MPRRPTAIAAAVRLFPAIVAQGAALGMVLGVAFGLTLGAAPSQAQSLSDLANAARTTGTGLFGSTEFESASLAALPQWQRVLRRMRQEREGFERCAADAAACASAAQRSWRDLIVEAAGLDRKAQLQAVNRFFNRWPYKLDHELYGMSEYWASPGEFMMRSGDCEDYAIAKFFALRQLGFDNDSMRIVILWDEIRAIGHAVLAVYEPEGTLVLDNLSRLIVPHTRYGHYIPQYSMNETTRWSHIHDKKIPHIWAQRN